MMLLIHVNNILNMLMSLAYTAQNLTIVSNKKMYILNVKYTTRTFFRAALCDDTSQGLFWLC